MPAFPVQRLVSSAPSVIERPRRDADITPGFEVPPGVNSTAIKKLCRGHRHVARIPPQSKVK